jgi:hypothetical protein
VKLTVILKKQDADGLGGEILENMGMTRSEVEDQVFSSYHLAPDLAGIQTGDVDDQMFSARITEALMDHGIRPMRVFQKTNSNAGLTPLSGNAGIESENEDYSVEDALAEMGLEEEDELSVDDALAQAGVVDAVDEGPTVEEALSVLDFNADDLLKDAGFLTTNERAPAAPAPAPSPVVTEIQQAKARIESMLKTASTSVSAGYTHYWNQSRDFTDQEWQKILRGAKSIIKKAMAQGIALAGGDGNGKPDLNAKYISLNGAGDESYETFFLSKEKDDEFNFTKTSERPYDPVVVSLLAMIKKVSSDAVDISSDGGDGVFRSPPIKAGAARRMG